MKAQLNADALSWMRKPLHTLTEARDKRSFVAPIGVPNMDYVSQRDYIGGL